MPVWPNLTAQPAILGAHVQARVARAARRRLGARPATTARRRDAGHAHAAGQRAEQPDRLDADARRAAGHRSTTAAAPAPGSSPTRSTSGSGSARAPAAPSFLDIAEPDDRLIVVHSFSKSFLMTGWRLGWLVLPRGSSRRDRQADRVQHLVRAGVRAARAAWPALQTAPDDGAGAGAAHASLPRHAGRLACSDCPACRWRCRRAACTPSSASGGAERRFAGLRQAPGRRARPRAWRRAWPSATRRKAGCAGALRHATRRGSTTGWPGWQRALLSL